MNKVVILHVIVGLGIGGAELMLKRLVDSSRGSTDCTHIVVSLTTLGTLGPQMVTSGIPVHTLGMRSALDMPKALLALWKLIRREKPDIVQTWMYHADLLGGLAARFAGCPRIIWGVRTTNVEAAGTRMTTVLMHLCARLSQWVPRVIVSAAHASRDVHVRLGYDATKMVVVHNGFDLSRLQVTSEERSAIRASCNFSENDVVIGIVGRFDPAKDFENFVKASGLVAAQHTRVRFLLVGRGLTLENQELKQWVTDAGVADRFKLLGESAEVPKYLSAMDVFCLSSRTEGFPNVVGEAMAIGLPCVVTDVGDAALLVGKTGFVVPKENPTALAEALEKLISMPTDERKMLGQMAKERIYEGFTIDRARERFDAIYRSISKE